ncbi:MAG: chemotaxis protein CheX [Planctomycetota bacterium]|nr:MAG: chemotaxis protein CheX [Planctomycetota bacterium]
MAKTVDVNLINPFIESTLECLQQMAGCQPSRKRVFIKKDTEMHGNISGVIGLSNGITGSCAVSFPQILAERIVAAFLGEELPLDEQMIHDGIGEVANMVAGGAKMRFSKSGFNFSISTPTVIAGSPTQLWNPAEVVSIACEFTARSDWEETFLIEVATKPADK